MSRLIHLHNASPVAVLSCKVGKARMTTLALWPRVKALLETQERAEKSTKNDSGGHRKMPGGWPDPGASSSDVDDEGDSDKGKKDNDGVSKGKGRQRGLSHHPIPVHAFDHGARRQM